MAKYEVPDHLLDKLKCGLCYEHLSYPPITLYAETGSVCGRCPVLEAEKNVPPLRESSYERVASILTFPCRYRPQGCPDTLPMHQVPTHEQTCSFKPYFCPAQPLGSCAWQGTPFELHGHFATNHQIMLLENPVFELDIINNYKEHYLIPMLDQLFLLRTEYSTSDEMFRFCVHMIAGGESFDKFTYEITFNTKDVDVSWKHPKKPVESDLNIISRENECSVNLSSLRDILLEPTTITCKLEITEIIKDQEAEIIVGEDVFVEEIEGEFEEEEEDEIISSLCDDVDKMLRDIECPVCQECMIPPIYQCVVGHSICGTCKPQLNDCPTCREKIGNTRNFTLEKITENMKYNCRNRHEGCMFNTNSANIRKHESECKFSPHRCPLSDTLNCDWLGNTKKIISHVKKVHPDYIQKDPCCTFKYNPGCTMYELMKVMEIHGEIFRIRYCYCNETKQVSCTVQCLAPSTDASKFMYEMHVIDLSNSGLKMMSKKHCGCISDSNTDIKHCTLWYLDMVTPMASNDKHLKMKCVITKV